MSIKQIIHEQYSKYKAIIYIYIAIIVFISFVSSPFMESYISHYSHAVEEVELLTEGETLEQLTTLFTGSSIKKLAGAYSSIVGVSCEPFTALVYIGLIENVNNLCGKPLDIVSTPAGNPWVFLTVAIFFMISKLMKSNEYTKVFGLCTLGELEKYLGLIFILVLGIENVTGLTDVAVTNATASLDSAVSSDFATNMSAVLSVCISVIMSIISIVVYFVIKTVISGIDTLQACFSFIPWSGAIFEILKSLLVIFIITVNILCPWLGVALNVIIFIICCFFFRSCYNITLFLNRVYVKPFLKGISGYSKSFPLVSKNTPKRILKYFEAQEKELYLSIPVYISTAKGLYDFKVKKLQRVWLITNIDGTYLVKKKSGKKKVMMCNVSNPVDVMTDYTDNQEFIDNPFEFIADDNYHIRKGFRYIEIFKYLDNDKNLKKKKPKKSVSIIMSREYFERYEDIINITGYINYNVIASEKKAYKKRKRKEKVENIKSGVSKRFDNVRNYFLSDNDPDLLEVNYEYKGDVQDGNN